MTGIQLAVDEVATKDHIDKSYHHIIFIVAPNNPTGTFPEEGVIETALSKDSLVFVDEAYVDFSKRTWAHIINAMENTFTVPYHLSYLQLVIAKHFDLIQPHLKGIADIIVSERERLASQFKEMGVSFIPSHGNFILFKVNNPPEVFQRLTESGVRFRSLHTIPGLSDYVRVTIGKKEENDLFIEKLRTLSIK